MTEDNRERPPTSSTTVLVASECQSDFADAIEKMLVGFGNGDLSQVTEALETLASGSNVRDLQDRVGNIVSSFHSTVSSVKHGLDPASITMTSTNIPDAARKLEYVLNATSDASHKLFLLVEKQEALLARGDAALAQLQTDLASGKPGHDVVATFAEEYKAWTADNREVLSSVVMTQEFQDLCGQALKKVLKLVEEMEKNLTLLLNHLGVDVSSSDKGVPGPDSTKIAQDNVDDLLKQFGF